jgi:hypothetical protein
MKRLGLVSLLLLISVSFAIGQTLPNYTLGVLNPSGLSTDYIAGNGTGTVTVTATSVQEGDECREIVHAVIRKYHRLGLWIWSGRFRSGRTLWS